MSRPLPPKRWPSMPAHSLIRNSEAPKPLLDAYAKGLADKKIPHRRI